MNVAKESSNLERGIKRGTRAVFIATATWVASTALLTFGPQKWWDYDRLATGFAIGVNLLAGAMMLFAFFRLLKRMDELQRQTHLEAMALTLGVTLIFTVIYGSLPTAHLLSESHPTNTLFVMGITYILSVAGLWAARTSE